jgi:nucleotide sugar dehydrogenase
MKEIMRKISVIGFGKIGQAVVANILNNDIQVTAIDINPELKVLFETGTYETSEPGLKDILVSGFQSGNLKITDDFSAIRGSAAVIVAIPLLVDKQKTILDEQFLACFRNIAPYLNDNILVVIETSIPVGYGRNTVVPVIESQNKKHGVDFLLVHSPERIKSGTMMEQLLRTPKIIGGVSKEAAERAYEIYQWFFDKSLLHVVDSIESAELVKLAGMAYRDVNIALSNQLAQFANSIQINFTDLIPLINTDGEANLLLPGIGVGGHCTPVYPYFLINNFKNVGLDFHLASESRTINDRMAQYAVSLVNNKVQNKKALVLGLSFKSNVKEDTFSTTYLLNDALRDAGFDVFVHDTEFSVKEIQKRDLMPTTDLYDSGAEAYFLVTMHEEYHHIDFQRLANGGCKYFVDGRNVIDRRKVEAAGIEYFGIGK